MEILKQTQTLSLWTCLYFIKKYPVCVCVSGPTADLPRAEVARLPKKGRVAS